MSAVFALIVAAGRGTRFGGDLPKQYLPLGGGTVLRHAVSAFAGASADRRGAGRDPAARTARLFDRAVAGLSVLPPVPGGAERQDSVRLGLEALARARPGAGADP